MQISQSLVLADRMEGIVKTSPSAPWPDYVHCGDGHKFLAPTFHRRCVQASEQQLEYQSHFQRIVLQTGVVMNDVSIERN